MVIKMVKKPRVLVTRKLPQTVEDKLSENFDTILNPDDSLYSTDELLRLSKNVDAI
ncbi:MAG: D-glycerate dehydrogenase, partial [Gammaproteobacteria bacterium]